MDVAISDHPTPCRPRPIWNPCESTCHWQPHMQNCYSPLGDPRGLGLTCDSFTLTSCQRPWQPSDVGTLRRTNDANCRRLLAGSNRLGPCLDTRPSGSLYPHTEIDNGGGGAARWSNRRRGAFVTTSLWRLLGFHQSPYLAPHLSWPSPVLPRARSGTHLIDTFGSGAVVEVGYITSDSRGAHAGWTVTMPINMGECP